MTTTHPTNEAKTKLQKMSQKRKKKKDYNAKHGHVQFQKTKQADKNK